VSAISKHLLQPVVVLQLYCAISETTSGNRHPVTAPELSEKTSGSPDSSGCGNNTAGVANHLLNLKQFADSTLRQSSVQASSPLAKSSKIH
jgi:hypothetical protein